MFDNADSGIIDLTLEERYQYKQHMFISLNNLPEESRKEYQFIIDSLFAELSNNGLNISIKNVACDNTTLLAAALELKILNEENRLLKQQLQDLKKQSTSNLVDNQQGFFGLNQSNKEDHDNNKDEVTTPDNKI